MSVRQYIGARYVPAFYENSLGTNVWQSGVAYEPLTIVTYNSNSYTSKKAVPATVGAPNLNPEYWASTGIYNAQIDEYRQEVQNVQLGLDTLTGTVNGLSSDLDDLSIDVSKIPTVGESDMLYVSKAPGSRFSTINAAITYARTYASTSRRVTIVIQGYGSTNIRYDEELNMTNAPYIDLVGINRPVVRANVAWRNATLWVNTQITVRGIRFENYYSPTGTETAGYALHNDPVSEGQHFIDCEFYSENNSAIGTATGDGGTVNFVNCTFRGKNGAYCHNKATGTSVLSVITFDRCYFQGFSSDLYDLIIDDSASMSNNSLAAPLAIYAFNCKSIHRRMEYRRGKPRNDIHYVPNGQTTGSSVYLTPQSSGNDMMGLNANMQTFSMYLSYDSAPSQYWMFHLANCSDYDVSFVSLTRYNRDGSGGTNIAESERPNIVTGRPYFLITLPDRTHLWAAQIQFTAK